MIEIRSTVGYIISTITSSLWTQKKGNLSNRTTQKKMFIKPEIDIFHGDVALVGFFFVVVVAVCVWMSSASCFRSDGASPSSCSGCIHLYIGNRRRLLFLFSFGSVSTARNRSKFNPSASFSSGHSITSDGKRMDGLPHDPLPPPPPSLPMK